MRRTRIGGLLCGLGVLAAACGERPAASAGADPDAVAPVRPPNIVWMVADGLDDPRTAPYGARVAAFAAAAESYALAAGDAAGGGASSAAALRSVLLTGVDAESLGLTADGLRAPPAAGIRSLPEQLRRAGYYTSRAGSRLHNLSPVPADAASGSAGAADAAVAPPGLLGAWDAAGPDADWRGRRKDWEHPCTVAFGCGGPPHDPERPFFAQFNLTATGDALDAAVGRVLDRLAEDGLERTTAVFLMGAAAGAPLVVRWPPGAAPAPAPRGTVRAVDLAPTALALAGAPIPTYMRGRLLLAAATLPGPPSAASGPPHAATADTPHAAAQAADGAPPTAETPAGYPTGGLFHVAPRVELWCGTEGSTIVYTTEREAPFYWRLYRGPFRMRFWTLRARCGRLGHHDSALLRYEFDIE